MSERVGYGRFPPEAVALGKALAHEVRWEVLVHLDENDHARFTDLEEATGKSSGALSPHLKTLRQGGLVEKIALTRDGEVVERYGLSPFGRRVLNRLEQAFSPETRIERTWKGGTDPAETIPLDDRLVEIDGTASGRNMTLRAGPDA